MRWHLPVAALLVTVMGAQAPGYSPGRLEQLAAPVALYPDPVLALVAQSVDSPDQLDELEGILRQRGGVSCAFLADYVDRRPWDASVKGLMDFPGVVDELSRNPSWLRNLGAAYVAQRADFLATVQTLRHASLAAEMLVTGPQQVVSGDAATTVRILPSDWNSISVPIYYPWAMFGDRDIPPMFLLLPPAVMERGRIRTNSWCGVAPSEYAWAAPDWDVDWNTGQIVYPARPVKP